MAASNHVRQAVGLSSLKEAAGSRFWTFMSITLSCSWWTFQQFFLFLLGGGEGGVRGVRKGPGVGFLN